MLAKMQSGAVSGIDAYIAKTGLSVSEGLHSFSTADLSDTVIHLSTRDICDQQVREK